VRTPSYGTQGIYLYNQKCCLMKQKNVLLDLYEHQGSGVFKGGAKGLEAPPWRLEEVSWDLFFGASNFCIFETVDLAAIF
jgi:hypothetical protein